MAGLACTRSLPKQLALADGAAPRAIPELMPGEKGVGRIKLRVNRWQLGHGGDCASGPEGFSQIATLVSVQTLAAFANAELPGLLEERSDLPDSVRLLPPLEFGA